MASQTTFSLPAKSRGFHLITSEVISKLLPLPETGVLHLFILHTSAGLTLNENADPEVRVDFETLVNRLVPEGQKGLQHEYEGPDDMPAHLKSSLMGQSVSIPIRHHQLFLGTWQGIYLCEFRNAGGSRRFVATVMS